MNTSKLTLSVSLIGIALLLITINLINPKIITIEKITISQLNNKIKTEGTITKIKNYDRFQIISITDDAFSIDIFVDKNTTLKENQNISVTGVIEKYKNQLQIKAEKITLHPLM